MKWPKFSVYDFFILLGFAIQYFYLFTEWEKYDNCDEPINYWFFLDWTSLLIVRFIMVLRYTDYPDNIKNTFKILLYGISLPALIIIGFVGLIWKNISDENSPNCIPASMVPWSLTLWIVITGLICIFILCAAIYDIIKYCRLRAVLIKMSREPLEPSKSMRLYSRQNTASVEPLLK